MKSDTSHGSPFPTPAYQGDRGDENPAPTPGADLGAIDYRGDPSAVGPPPAQGQAVGPMPDRGIQTYDFPDQLHTYDHMGQE